MKRVLIIVSLLSLFVGLLIFGFRTYVQRTVVLPAAKDSLAFFETFDVLRLNSQLQEAEKLAALRRVEDGNAAPIIIELIVPFRSADVAISEVDIKRLAHAASMKTCRFYPDVYAFVDDPFQLEVPELFGFNHMVDRALERAMLESDSGNPASAQAIYLDLVSIGDHLARNVAPLSYIVGVAILQRVAPALTDFYMSINHEDAPLASQVSSAANQIHEQRTKVFRSLGGICLSEQGLTIIEGWLKDDSFPISLQVELQLQASIIHYFDMGGLIFGPSKIQKKVFELVAESEDEDVRRFASMYRPYLEMTIRQRLNAMDVASTLN